MAHDDAWIEPIFAEALERPSAEAAAAFLGRACGEDAALRRPRGAAARGPLRGRELPRIARPHRRPT